MELRVDLLSEEEMEILNCNTGKDDEVQCVDTDKRIFYSLSDYTGEPITKEEMKNWRLQKTVSLLMGLLRERGVLSGDDLDRILGEVELLSNPDSAKQKNNALQKT